MKLTQQEINKLDHYIQSANQSSKEPRDICWTEGYLCAICTSPELIMPTQWMKHIHNDGFEFNSEKEANDVMSLLMRLYNNTIKHTNDESYEPIYEWHKFNNNESKTDLAARWSKGYMFATMMVNGELLKEDGIMATLLPIIVCSGVIPEQEVEKENITKEQLIDKIPLAVKFANDFFKELREDFIPTHISKTIVNDNKIGRNDPCYCGSQKKYKKCCIAKADNDNMNIINQEDPELFN